MPNPPLLVLQSSLSLPVSKRITCLRRARTVVELRARAGALAPATGPCDRATNDHLTLAALGLGVGLSPFFFAYYDAGT